DVVRYTLKRFEEDIEKALAARRQGDADRRRQQIDLERKIANQLRGLSDGYSRLITEEIARLEYQLNSLRDRLQVSAPGTAKLQMRDTRRFVECRLRDSNTKRRKAGTEFLFGPLTPANIFPGQRWQRLCQLFQSNRLMLFVPAQQCRRASHPLPPFRRQRSGSRSPDRRRFLNTDNIL